MEKETRDYLRRAARRCRQCYGGWAGQAFSEGKCEVCGDKIVSATWPCDKVCHRCSVEYFLCCHCGKPMEENV